MDRGPSIGKRGKGAIGAQKLSGVDLLSFDVSRGQAGRILDRGKLIIETRDQN